MLRVESGRERFCLFIRKLCEKSERSFLMLLETILKTPSGSTVMIRKPNFKYPLPSVVLERWQAPQAGSECGDAGQTCDCRNWHFVPTSQRRGDKGK